MCRIYGTLWGCLFLLFAPLRLLVKPCLHNESKHFVLHLHCFPPKHFIKGSGEWGWNSEKSEFLNSLHYLWPIFPQRSSWCYTLTVWIHLVGCEHLHTAAIWSTEVLWGSNGHLNSVQVCAAATGRNPVVVFFSVAKAVSETLGALQLQDKSDL